MSNIRIAALEKTNIVHSTFNMLSIKFTFKVGYCTLNFLPTSSVSFLEKVLLHNCLTPRPCHSWISWTCNFAPVTFDHGTMFLNLETTWKSWKNLLAPAVTKVLRLCQPVLVYGLPMMVYPWCAWACHFADVTLTLEILWQLLYPTHWCYIGQFGYKSLPTGVGVHRHVILPCCLWI